MASSHLQCQDGQELVRVTTPELVQDTDGIPSPAGAFVAKSPESKDSHRTTSSSGPAVGHAKRNPHKDATYVYQRVSKTTGFTSWWGDFRRFADVGGRLERLAPYLRPDEGEVRDAEHARTVYWRGVDQYQEKRRAADSRGEATPSLREVEASRRRAPDTPQLRLVRGEYGQTHTNAAAVAPDAVSTSPYETLLPKISALVELLATNTPVAPQIKGADMRLSHAVTEHLAWKRQQVTLGNGRIGTCETDETSFKSLCRILGPDCPLREITVQRLEVYITQRLNEPGWRKDTTISTATVRNELHALSNLFTKLADRDIIALPNPVSKLTMPAPPDEEAEYMQLAEMARLLDAAVLIDIETAKAVRGMEIHHRVKALGARGRRRPPEEQAQFDLAEALYPKAIRGEAWHRRFRFVEALLATFLYTGARSEEVRGLMVEEIDWDRDEIVLRFNEWRGLKCVHCTRRVPMPPELRRILRRYLEQTGITCGLLFVGGSEEMLGSLQTILPRALKLAGIAGDITPHSLRHTYATAMLHTWAEGPNGQLVQRSSHNVAKLLGQIDSKLVDKTYGHLLWDAGMMEELSLDALRRFPSTRQR